MSQNGTSLSSEDASTAAELRERFGFLREVVAEMERSVPYAAALMRASEGLRLDLRDGGQTANRLDPMAGVVLTPPTIEARPNSVPDPMNMRRRPSRSEERPPRRRKPPNRRA